MRKSWRPSPTKRPLPTVQLGFERLESRCMLSGSSFATSDFSVSGLNDLVQSSAVLANKAISSAAAVDDVHGSEVNRVRLYFDLNGNGNYDVDEPGAPDNLIYLDDNNSGKFDLGDSRVTTDENGLAEIPSTVGLKFRVYTSSRKLAGFSTNLDLPPVATETGYTQWFSVHLGSQETAYIGLIPYVNLKGQVFSDSNDNSVLDLGDRPLGGVIIKSVPTFTDGSTPTLGDRTSGYTTTGSTSDSSGHYSVRYQYSAFNQHKLLTLDAKPELVAGYTWTKHVQPGIQVTYDTVTYNVDLLVHSPEIDQGPTTSVHGRVFFDLNGNKLFDDGDVGAPGIDVFSNQDGSLMLSADDEDVKTNLEGLFELPRAIKTNGGTIGVITDRVMASKPAGATYLGQYKDFNRSPSITQHIFSVSSSFTNSFDIALTPLVYVEGKVFEDLNENGKLDTSDRPVNTLDISGRFKLAGEEPRFNVTSTAKTDATGHYVMQGRWNQFSDVPREIEVTPQFGAEGFSWTTLPTTGYHTTADGIIYTVDFAIHPFQTILGALFLDVDADGVKDNLRPILPAGTSNGSEDGETGYPSVKKDPDGTYGGDDIAAATLSVMAVVERPDGTFARLGPPGEAALDGKYTLRVPAEAGQTIYVLPNLDPASWIVISPSGGVALTTASLRKTIENIDFGILPKRGIDFALGAILDEVFLESSEGSNDLSFILDQSERDALRDVSAGLPERVAAWRENLPPTKVNPGFVPAGYNSPSPAVTSRTFGNQSPATIASTSTFGPLKLTRDFKPIAPSDFSVISTDIAARDPVAGDADLSEQQGSESVVNDNGVEPMKAKPASTLEGDGPLTKRQRKKKATPTNSNETITANSEASVDINHGENKRGSDEDARVPVKNGKANAEKAVNIENNQGEGNSEKSSQSPPITRSAKAAASDGVEESSPAT